MLLYNLIFLIQLMVEFVNLQYLKTMGSSQVIPHNTNTKSKLENYELVRRQGEGRTLMRSKDQSALVLAIEHTFSDENQLREYALRSKMSMTVSHQFYLNAFDYQIISQSTICSSQYKMVELFDYQPHTLKRQIQNRLVCGKTFSAQEVTSILCSCVLVMSHFSRCDTLHYTLNPSDIIIDSEGICKVVSSCLSEYLFDYTEKKDFYYSPETLKMFRQQKMANGLTNKSAVFTLGVTLLEVNRLQQMSHLYNYSTYTINAQLLQEQLEKIQDLQLKMILSKMLKVHSYERIAFTELEEMLFQMITSAEKDKNKVDQSSENIDEYQIAKLQQSIVKIKSQHQVSNQGKIESAHKLQMPQRQNSCLGCLYRDEQDISNDPKYHLLQSIEDSIVYDQFQQPMLQQLSESALENPSELPLTILTGHYKSPGNILTDNSNISNGLVSYRQFSSSHYRYRSTDKENLIEKYNFQTKKSMCPQQFPQYVSEKSEDGQYQGYKLGGYRHGFGSVYYDEGGKYCGQWVKGKMEGKGVLYYSSGKIAYEGEWKQDRLHGYGVLYNQNIAVCQRQFDYNHLQLLEGEWIKYEGYFQNDVKKGHGTIFLSNGESYRGLFENDQPHGMGEFRNVRGELIKGCWLMGALNILS